MSEISRGYGFHGWGIFPWGLKLSSIKIQSWCSWDQFFELIAFHLHLRKENFFFPRVKAMNEYEKNNILSISRNSIYLHIILTKHNAVLGFTKGVSQRQQHGWKPMGQNLIHWMIKKTNIFSTPKFYGLSFKCNES